eukprot:jgi/Mesen1/1917/ME000144S01042
MSIVEQKLAGYYLTFSPQSLYRPRNACFLREKVLCINSNITNTHAGQRLYTRCSSAHGSGGDRFHNNEKRVKPVTSISPEIIEHDDLRRSRLKRAEDVPDWQDPQAHNGRTPLNDFGAGESNANLGVEDDGARDTAMRDEHVNSQDLAAVSTFTNNDNALLRSVFKDIWMLAIPALGAVLSDPLMSLIDTGCVGQLGTRQLAALGPNVSIFNLVFQVYTFMGAATCNILAGCVHQVAGEEQGQQQEAGRMLSHAVILAVILGIATTAFLECLGPHLLAAMGAGADIMPPALAYLRVRALSAPAVLVIIVAQGACLGSQDAQTPLAVYAVAALVNSAGDYFLALKAAWGVEGAAWATLVAQCVAAALFVRCLLLPRRPQPGRTGGSLPRLQWHGWPTMRSLRPYFHLAGPLVLRVVLGMAVYTLVARAAAAVGTVELAAHQVAMQCLWTLSYFAEPLSIAAQSLIARDLAACNRQKVTRMARLLLLFAAALGLVLALAIAGISYWGTALLCADARVRHMVASVAPQSMLCMLFCSLTMAMDGTAIASGDVVYVAQAQAVNLVVVTVAVAAVHSLQLGLAGIWWSLVLFFAARLMSHCLHVASHWHSHALGDSQAILRS